MFNMQQKLIRYLYMKKQENITHTQETESVPIRPKMTQLLKLEEGDFKTAPRNYIQGCNGKCSYNE